MKEELTDIEMSLTLPPSRKNKRGQLVHRSQKLTIIELHKKMKEKNPNILNKNAIAKLVAQTGIGSCTIKRTLLEYRRTGVVTSPNTKKRRLSFKEKIDEIDKNSIRRKIHEFYTNNELPTLRKVMQTVNADDNLPNFKRTTFYALLKELNFTYTTRNRNTILTENEDLILCRRNYLRTIKRYREEGRPIYYLDETVINASNVIHSVWIDETVKSEEDALVQEPSTGPANQNGKIERLIVLHIGSMAGFVPGGLLCLESKRITGNYYEEMNGDTFLKWFKNISPSLEDNAVIVMDNAPHHSVKEEELPNESWKKDKIIRWLEGRGKEISETMVKAELLQIVARQKDRFDKYVIDETAKQENMTVLRLPPYHCELNPIGMVWPMVKGYVNSNNNTCKILDVKILVEQGVDRVTTEHWRNVVRHVRDEEKKLWEIDHIADRLIDAIPALANNVTGETDSETSDSDQ